MDDNSIVFLAKSKITCKNSSLKLFFEAQLVFFLHISQCLPNCSLKFLIYKLLIKTCNELCILAPVMTYLKYTLFFYYDF